MSSLRTQYEQAFGMKDITTPAMAEAIMEWNQLYYNREATEQEDPCQRIAYTIVHKLTKTCFSEYEVETKDEFAKTIAEALGGGGKAGKKKRKAAMQKAMLSGVAWIKPVPVGSGGQYTGFRFTIVPRANVLIFGRDGDEVTDMGTWELSTEGMWYYTLLERRTVDGSGYLRILSKLYRSKQRDLLGGEVPLSTLAKYEQLQPELIYGTPVGSIGMIPLEVPMENCVDGSEDPCAVYAAAAGLIHNINHNEAQLNGEFERGESRIIADASMLEPVRPTRQNDELDNFRFQNRRKLQDHVFVALEGGDETGITIFSPELRNQSFQQRKTEYLRNCESLIGLQRGLLADVQEQQKTATEITDSKGDYALSIQDLQEAWEEMFGELLQLCAALGKLYHIPGAQDLPEDAVVINWGNGVLYDEAATWQDMKDQVSRGLMRPTKAVGWKHGMPTDTPAQEEAVRKAWMPQEVEELID